MSDQSRKKSSPPPLPISIRDTLFGDLPLEQWPADASRASGEPWASFVAARDALAGGRADDAIAAWTQITEMPDLESRHYLQAWHFLRAQGQRPDGSLAKQL